jgi:hypothetical protein
MEKKVNGKIILKLSLKTWDINLCHVLIAGQEPTKGSTNTVTKLFVYKTTTRTFSVIDHLVVDSAH